MSPQEAKTQIEEHFAEGCPAVLEVPDGWLVQLGDLHRDLMNVDPTYKVEQVKEKYNGLRFYLAYDNSNLAQLQEIVDDYEKLSYGWEW